MPVTIKINGTNLSLVHKFSNGISTATIPDVCKTPSPGGPVPMPYPNIAQSITLSDGTTSVKGDKMMAATKGSKFALSNGDNPGVAGGVKSSTFMKEATWILYSFTVKLQSKGAARLTDKMFHNAENAANLTGVIQALVAAGLSEEEANLICEAFCDVQREYNKPDSELKGRGCCSRAFESRINALRSQGKLPAGVLAEESFFLGRLGAQRLTPELANRLMDLMSPIEALKVVSLPLTVTPGGAVTANIATKLAEGLKSALMRRASGIIRPDLIVEMGGNRTVLDAKFDYSSRHGAGHRDTMSDAQRRSYRKLGKPPKDPAEITPEGCGC